MDTALMDDFLIETIFINRATAGTRLVQSPESDKSIVSCPLIHGHERFTEREFSANTKR